MSKTANFQSLPPEYQQVIQLAQEQHRITVTPLQLLTGGWSGAMVYLISVSTDETTHVEHCVLKLDRKGKGARTDEVTRHTTVVDKAPTEFARKHIAELLFDRVEQDGAIAIFYRIAGQSLLNYLPLSKYERQNQLKTLFAETNNVLLNEWNANAGFEQAVHPQKVLKKWLGFRLDAGGNIEHFLQDTCGLHPDIAGFLIDGHVFPNPLFYARKPGEWGEARLIDIITGFIHGDLNTNNILAKFSEDKLTLNGYYLIDFALFKENKPLLYDQRYLEMSYLIQIISQVSFEKCVDFMTRQAVADVIDPHKIPIELSGVSAVIESARSAFALWVTGKHPSLHDDLWGQYWLAGVAAGLAYCHKVGLPDKVRLAGLIYAAANLRRYLATFGLPLPTNVELLYDKNKSDPDSPGAFKRPKHNLPVQPTPFIGRTIQLAALKELLQTPEVRLVTLLGPGGTGKTRLSLQVAQEVLGDFPDGVFFVPLADDKDTHQFVSRVAQQLEVREGGRPLLENIKDYLRGKQILLVLDNFEQLVSSSPTVAELLASTPGLKLIVSSRIALQVQGEHEFLVPPLELPLGENDLEKLMDNESVALFIERAQALSPSFTLTQDNVSSVAEICRRLDGLPLALELAAVRVKLLSPRAILARLDDSLKLLTGGARDLPARQQTLRNTIEWSFNLLNSNEKILFARLSVFVNGFGFEAAEAICNPENEFDILEGLTALVNNSLLRQDETAEGEPRFGMLETIRAFALECLAESGEKKALQARHAQYFGNIIIDQASTGLYSPKATYWLSWLEQEHDNVRAVLRWCQADPQMAEFAGGLVMSLLWFWYRRGYFSEGRMWANQLLASPAFKTPEAPRGFALAASGLMAMWQGEQDIALRQVKESREIWQRLEAEEWVATTLMGNGIALINMGRDREALPFLQEALKLFEEQNNPYFHTFTLVHLGNVELGLGNIDQAQVWLEQALSDARLTGEGWSISFALNNLGEVARTQGRYEQARTYYEESEAILRASGAKGDLARLVHTLGYIAQHEGNYEKAESQFRKSLAMFRQLGNRRGMAECMAGLAGLKARQGNVEWAAIMLSAAETALQATGGAWWPADRVEVDANREIINLAFDEAGQSTARKRGQEMSLEQALTFATA